jgi:ectoine hydroxylase-related dioxygenase (phytanoyl-CoA dioxygenase family)
MTAGCEAGKAPWKNYILSPDSIDAAVRELTHGRGYVVLEGLFDRDTVAEARARVLELAATEAPTIDPNDPLAVFDATDHVWNLVDKGAVFERMVQEPTILAVFSRILGAEVRLGSFAARIVAADTEPQTPHCDYPYWDLDKPATFPMGLNSGYFLNCQSTLMLDDFTVENGATRVAPGTQVHGRFPTAAAFEPIAEQTTGPAGSAMLMTGLLWHCAGVNRTDSPRVGILGQYLPQFVKPMEDQRASVSAAVVERAGPELRSLLGIDDAYPQVLDPALV